MKKRKEKKPSEGTPQKKNYTQTFVFNLRYRRVRMKHVRLKNYYL